MNLEGSIFTAENPVLTHDTFKEILFQKISISPIFCNAVIGRVGYDLTGNRIIHFQNLISNIKDRYLSGDFGIDFNKKKFYDLDSSELNLLGNFHYHHFLNL